MISKVKIKQVPNYFDQCLYNPDVDRLIVYLQYLGTLYKYSKTEGC